VSRQTGSRSHSLLRTIESNAKSPAIVIFMKQSNQLTNAEPQFIIHRRTEIHLHTMNIQRTRAGSRTSGISGRDNRSRSGHIGWRKIGFRRGERSTSTRGRSIWGRLC